jgi:hypothetical protein
MEKRMALITPDAIVLGWAKMTTPRVAGSVQLATGPSNARLGIAR